MKIASNVVAHDPEVNPRRIEASRLLAHGWSVEAVNKLQSRNRAESEMSLQAEPQPQS